MNLAYIDLENKKIELKEDKEKSLLDIAYKTIGCDTIDMADVPIFANDDNFVYSFVVDDAGLLVENPVTNVIVDYPNNRINYVGKVCITKVDIASGDSVELDQNDMKKIASKIFFTNAITNEGKVIGIAVVEPEKYIF